MCAATTVPEVDMHNPHVNMPCFALMSMAALLSCRKAISAVYKPYARRGLSARQEIQYSPRERH